MSAGGMRALIDQRGYVVLYRPADTNYCPGCHGTSWHVGRSTAECASCGTAIDLAAPYDTGGAPTIVTFSREG